MKSKRSRICVKVSSMYMTHDMLYKNIIKGEEEGNKWMLCIKEICGKVSNTWEGHKGRNRFLLLAGLRNGRKIGERR